MHTTWEIGNAFHRLLLLILCIDIRAGRVYDLNDFFAESDTVHCPDVLIGEL